ncbi:MAG: hypothetical protein KDB60_01025 [Propionibacteriaceae bacterium]|nr:hypothetical protein [Propionibacteriaceae bacterium]
MYVVMGAGRKSVGWVLVDHHDPLGAPSDLAEGPMMPRNLPGYAAGLAAGQFRPPPEQPPIPLPGVPGNVRNIAQYVVPVAVFAAIPLLRGFVPFPALGVGAVGSIIILGWWATRRLYAELDAGYVTRPTAQVWAGGRSSMKWSFRGIWVLTWSGRVKAEPERGLDAPGFYPSPARPGMLQLWTGVEWFPKFREPPAERP